MTGAFGKNRSTFGKMRRNPYPGTSRTNPETNHKSVANVLIKKVVHKFYKLLRSF